MATPLTGQPIPQPDNTPKTQQPDPEYAQWGKLNKSLLAKIYTVDKFGVKNGDYTVVCAITEGTFEVGSEYSSPFDANPDQRLPTLMGMIQSGEFVSAVGNVAANLADTKVGIAVRSTVESAGNVLNTVTGGASGSVFGAIGDSFSGSGDALKKLEGKTNLTKINSVQIFTNTKPIELSVTLYFRAWRDAKKEVEEPCSMLERWALPVSLSQQSIAESLSASAASTAPKGESILGGLFPSVVPPFVALQYAGKTFLPFTIRSVSRPLVTERDSNMNALAAVVTCQLSSRTAWDANDIKTLYGY